MVNGVRLLPKSSSVLLLWMKGTPFISSVDTFNTKVQVALRFSYRVKCKQLVTFNFLIAVKYFLTPCYATPLQ